MKKSFIKIARGVGKLFGKKNAAALIKLLYRVTDAPILSIGYQHYGILKYENMEVSGEKFVAMKIVRPLIQDEEVLIDVGANVGEYTALLEKYFTKQRIISIEPNPHAYKFLKEKVSSETYNNAISEEEGELVFYSSSSNQLSTQASFSINSIPENQVPLKMKVNTMRLDSLLKLASVDRVGFLKVDTEGFDLHVLKSAGGFLKRIKFVQFEFNETYVYTRTFLKDFYELLDASHDIFRLDSVFLHDTRKYLPTNEIFRYQNFLAVRKDLTSQMLWAVKN